MIRGLDVSRMQGVPPWGTLALAGLSFVYIRCDVGNDGKDGSFDANVAGARAVGLRVGSYTVAYPLDHVDPIKRAQFDFEASLRLGLAPGDLPPALDLEWPVREKQGQAHGAEWKRWGCTPASIRAWALAWLRETARLCGRQPIIYTFKWFWLSVLEGATPEELAELATYPLWFATDYGKFGAAGPPEGYKPVTLAPWPSVTLEQWDGDGGAVMPNGADADFDVFLGDEADWEAFLGLPPSPATESAPGGVTEGPA